MKSPTLRRWISLLLAASLVGGLCGCAVPSSEAGGETAAPAATSLTSANAPTEAPETEAPAPPPPLPTPADLQAGYVYDWDPMGYTMDFSDLERSAADVVVVEDLVYPDYLTPYREFMQASDAYGEYALCLDGSGEYLLPELSVDTDPAFFEAGNTFSLRFTTLTFCETMVLWVYVETEQGKRIVSELEAARGTVERTVTFTVAEGDRCIGIMWMPGEGGHPMLYIGDLEVGLTIPE